MKSKAWNWNVADEPQWNEPAGEVYPLLSRWKKQGFKKLLDLGCGTGRHSILFAQNGFDVEAFDLGKEGLDKLEAFNKILKLPITTKLGDMIDLPYKDGEFDCLIAFHAIYHQDDDGIKKVINEIKRVLKSGGEAFITFNSQNSSSYNSPDTTKITRNTIIKNRGYEEGIPHFMANKNDVENLLEDFEILEFSYREDYHPDLTGAHYFVLAKKK